MSQQVDLRYARLQDALSSKTPVPPTVHAFIRALQQRARPLLDAMGPFNTAIVESPAGLGRIVVGLQPRICTYQIHNLPCSYALVTIDVAGK